ncbi:hypothetical protein KCU65_g2405, partial [Aureobasidium melanogenum]
MLPLDNPWFDEEHEYYRARRVQKHLAVEKLHETYYGCYPNNASMTDAQWIAYWESVWLISEGNSESREQCLRWMKDSGVSKTTSEGGDMSETTNGNDTVQELSEDVHSEHKQEASGAQMTSMNSDDDSKASSTNKSTLLPNNLSQSASQEVAKERGPLNMSKNNNATEEQLASKDESTSDPWSNEIQSILKDEMEVNKHLSKRLQNWKDILAAKKHSSPNNEDEQSVPSDVLDFNASMLDRENYDDLLTSATTNKQSLKTSSKPTLEKVSSSEQATAINALLYGLTVLKAVTPIQQHEMVTSLLHPKVRKMQPSLAFEMNALLLDLDTEKLLMMSVDEDALHTRAKKVARA